MTFKCNQNRNQFSIVFCEINHLYNRFAVGSACVLQADWRSVVSDFSLLQPVRGWFCLTVLGIAGLVYMCTGAPVV